MFGSMFFGPEEKKNKKKETFCHSNFFPGKIKVKIRSFPYASMHHISFFFGGGRGCEGGVGGHLKPEMMDTGG
jgi:hypothetical protein